ncbi:MAG TPA: hypothetical protein VGP61_04185 [Gemmatimonadales bacterium]|jgi:hypothetical protein|nr:hypothetical protein [Gemmatimonadales bacterium]
MTFSFLLLTLALHTPADLRAVSDTARARKPPASSPSAERGKPAPPPKAPTLAPKGKPPGEPELRRRKPPAVDFKLVH